MPDTISCDSAVSVQAGNERQGLRAELQWLNAFYPRHGPYTQALQRNGRRSYDVLTFRRADGRAASVCFDITEYFGNGGAP